MLAVALYEGREGAVNALESGRREGGSCSGSESGSGSGSGSGSLTPINDPQREAVTIWKRLASLGHPRSHNGLGVACTYNYHIIIFVSSSYSLGWLYCSTAKMKWVEVV
jgi:hypothetical protein